MKGYSVYIKFGATDKQQKKTERKIILQTNYL